MGSIVSAITGGGGSGVNFRAQAPNIEHAATTAQANEQYKNVQDALAQQQQFVNAVQAQNGLGNQTSVFNQLQNVANGQGPNPAQAMLANTTGANVANQAALMAGQRGSSANVGLMSRQIANQGANTQQQAAGQGAALQAQQSLGALNQMGGIANQQAGMQQAAVTGYTGATQAEQKAILDQITAQNNAEVGAATSMNSSNSSLAGKVAEGQMNMFGNIAGGLGAGLMLAAEGGKVPSPKKMMAEGGDDFTSAPADNAGMQDAFKQLTPTAPTVGPKSRVGQFLSKPSNLVGDKANPISAGSNQLGQGIGKLIGQGASAIGSGISNLINPTPSPQTVAGGPMDTTSPAPEATDMSGATPDNSGTDFMAARGGKVPAMLSPGERYLPPSEVKKVAKGEKDPMKAGKHIPGKAKVKGNKNSYANDTVPMTLEEGGIVLPRSVTQSKHPHWEAHKFVAALMKKQALSKGK